MLLPEGIKAVFYDLDGTLRVSDPPGRVVFADQAASRGLPVTAEDRLRAARWEHYYFAASDEILADRTSFPDGQAFWINYSRRQLVALGASPERAEELVLPLHEYMNEYYRPQDLLMPDVQQALRALKEAGLLLAVVSNREESYQDYLNEIGLGEYFDFSLAAGEVKAWKPDVRIFQHALERAGLQAGQAVYVGDNYFADVVGARNAGMRPVLLDVAGMFEQPDCPVIRTHVELLGLLELGKV